MHLANAQETGSGDNHLSSLIQNYWNAETAKQKSAAIQAILRSDAGFDELYRILKSGRNYSPDVKRGFLSWDRRTSSGVQLYALVLVPYNYTPDKKWPVRVTLHGDVSHIDPYNVHRFIDTTQESYKTVEEIRIYPSAYFAARWYYPLQYDNVMQLLDSVKELYNVDENLVTLGGFSDGGTGTYSFANYDVTPYCCFLPFIGSCAGLKFLGSKQVYFNNFTNKPMFIENGALDRTFPPEVVIPWVEQIQRLNPDVTFFMIDTSGHSLRWLPGLKDSIDHFILQHRRNPYPSHLSWQTEDKKKFNRNHWMIINSIGKTDYDSKDLVDHNEVFLNGNAQQAFRRDSMSAMIDVIASGNEITVKTKNVKSYTLLLSPDQFDFSQPIKIITNNMVSFNGSVKKDREALLKWNATDNDRTMLFGTEVQVKVGKESRSP